MSFVLDASVTMAWCYHNESSPYVDSVFDQTRVTNALVPAIWPLEIANALLSGERRRRLTEAQSARFVQVLQSLPITVDDGALSGAWGPVLALARERGLSAYDAAYLELAMREGLPLATIDSRLSAAAAAAGVPLLA